MPKKIGTSAFTHQDDASAPIHTTNAEHTEAHVYGGEATDKNEEATIVLGPPAFGSPDVRTLGHIMRPDVKPASAPKLDANFEALQAVESGGVITEEELNQMTKSELMSLADQMGVDVNSSMKKDEIIDALAEEKNVESDEGSDEDSDNNDSDYSNDGDDDAGDSGQDDQGN